MGEPRKHLQLLIHEVYNLSESDMIEILLNQISTIKSIKKVFMKKRDVKVYDDTWNTISEQLTEYDVDIITYLIAPNEWNKLVTLEKDFLNRFPNLKFNYSLIESDPISNTVFEDPNAKLIYSAGT